MFPWSYSKTSECPVIRSLAASANFMRISEFIVMKSHFCVQLITVVSVSTKKVTCDSTLKRFIQVGQNNSTIYHIFKTIQKSLVKMIIKINVQFNSMIKISANSNQNGNAYIIRNEYKEKWRAYTKTKMLRRGKNCK